jgi:hypothetical protein
VTHQVQHLKRVENILFVEEGTIKLHGSYRYLSERGIDFDRILRAYETNDDENEEEEKMMKEQEKEKNLDINVYDLSDEYLDDDDSEDEGEESEEDYKKDSLKLERQIQDWSPAGKQTRETEAHVSLKTTESLIFRRKSKQSFKCRQCTGDPREQNKGSDWIYRLV